MRFLSLFAGIGGFDLGLERAGMTCAGQVEIDPFCLAVLAKHWPDVKRLTDIREVKGDEFGPIDVVCGGFPCQPWSVAGKRGGEADDRDVWPEMLGIVAAARPAWVVGENVAGLGSMAFRGVPLGVESRTGGRTADGVDYEAIHLREEHMQLGRICDDLDSLGYEVIVFEIPACAVDAPHKRSRLWIVAHGAGTGWAATRRAEESSERCTDDIASSGETVAHGDQQRRQQDARGALGDEEAHGRARREQCKPDGDYVITGDGEGRGLAALEHAAGDGRREGRPEHELRRRRPAAAEPGGDVAYAEGDLRRTSGHEGRDSFNGASAFWSGAERIAGRRVKPGVRLLADGVPGRVDQLRALGNAVVPQIVERIGGAMLQAEQTTS